MITTGQSFSHTATVAAGRPSRPRPSVWARFTGLLALHRQRQALARLDDDLLRDIGLTRAEAEAEARRPIWSVPDRWHR